MRHVSATDGGCDQAIVFSPQWATCLSGSRTIARYLPTSRFSSRYTTRSLHLYLHSAVAGAFTWRCAVALSNKRLQESVPYTYLLPLVVPVTSVVMIIQTVFQKNACFRHSAWRLAKRRLTGSTAFAFFVMVACYLWKYLGYNVILWLAGLSAIPESYYEAARVDGANEAQSFFAITLPLLKSTMFMTLVLGLINSFKVFREAYLVAGRYPNRSIYMLQHVLSNWFSDLDMQKISAAAVLLMAGILVAVLLAQRGLERRKELE
jgi:multiple sugar transport system permease protein